LDFSARLCEKTKILRSKDLTYIEYALAGLFRIRMAGEDGEGAIDLFGEKDAGEFVRHRQRGKRNLQSGDGAQFVGKASGIATKKNQFAKTGVAMVPEPFCKMRGSELLSRRVEKDDGGIRGHFALPPRGRIAQLGHLHFSVARDPSKVIFEQRARLGPPRFSQHHKMNFHVGRRRTLLGFDEAVLFTLVEKRLARDAENLCGARDFVVRGFQRRVNRFALEFFK